MSTAVDWSELPPELLQTISAKSQTLADYIRFSAVCRTWRSASPISTRHLPREFPWLMLPLTLTLTPTSNRRVFLNPLTKTLARLTLPEASATRRRAGSSHGWLALIDDSSPSIFIINPLTRDKYTLPLLSSFPNVTSFDFYNVGREYALRSPYDESYYFSLKEMRDLFIKKVVISHNPYSVSTFAAFAILNRYGEVAYCRNGDSSWKMIEFARSYSEDVIYFNGAFYAVDKYGSIAICYVEDGELPSVECIHVELVNGGDMQYLVDGMGELLLVSRYIEFEIDIEQYLEVCKTVKFCVYRLDMRSREWVRVTSLGDKVLFLGGNSSFALSASDYAGCDGNRIYFTDDYSGANYDGIAGDYDVGVYNLEDDIINVLPCYPRNSHWPIWITPTLR